MDTEKKSKFESEVLSLKDKVQVQFKLLSDELLRTNNEIELQKERQKSLEIQLAQLRQQNKDLEDILILYTKYTPSIEPAVVPSNFQLPAGTSLESLTPPLETVSNNGVYETVKVKSKKAKEG